MGDRELRNVQRIDYSRLHSDGVRVPLLSGSSSADETLLAEPDGDTLLTESHSESDFLTANEDVSDLSNLCASSEESITSEVEVDRERSLVVTAMSNPTAVAKASGELAGLVFQVQEILDELHTPDTMSLEVLQGHLDELKMLRINVVKVSSELKVLMPADAGGGDDARPAATVSDDTILRRPSSTAGGLNVDVPVLLEESKKMIAMLRHIITQKQTNVNNDMVVAQQEKDLEVAAVKRERKFAFDKIVEEVIGLIGGLRARYNIKDDDRTLTAEIVQKRKEMKSSYVTDYNRLVLLMDRILQYTDVQFQGKETMLNNYLASVSRIEDSKAEFEAKLYLDIERFDLSDQKVKLAANTKVDIGKFSGSLEKGLDFYTFKTKFLKAYSGHPKSLRVEWLVNNHLEGKAKECVGSLDDEEEIWMRLKKNFGNTEQILRFQLNKIKLMGGMNKIKSVESKRNFVQKMVNTIEDVCSLADDHDLTGELHYGNHLPKIVNMLERHIQDKWYRLVVDEKLSKPAKWPKLLEFLTDELEVLQERCSEMQEAEDQKRETDNSNDSNAGSGGRRRVDNTFLVGSPCIACDEQHPNSGAEFVQCRTFLLLTPKEKAELVRKKKRCLQCLCGTAKWDSNHNCADAWVCPHESHGNYKKKLHFLLCEKHCEDDENKKLFELYKEEVLKAGWQKKLHSSIFVTSLVPVQNDCSGECDTDVLSVDQNDGVDAYSTEGHTDTPAYILQTCVFYEKEYSCMFDSGCRGFVVRDAAVESLPAEHKTNTQPGPLIIGGVGGTTAVSGHGEFTVELPTHDGRLASFNGISLPVITGTMPPYPVKEARKSLVKDYIEQGGSVRDLPDVPAVVGGETDLMFGLQYNWYLPRMVHILPTGLAIYKSMFVGVNGTRGCIGGPHEVFRQCEQRFYKSESNIVQFRVYLQQQLSLFNSGLRVCLDVSAFSSCLLALCSSVSAAAAAASTPSLSVDEDNGVSETDSATVVERKVVIFDASTANAVHLSTKVKFFEKAEEAGSSIEYRCVRCRGCADCRKGEHTEMISFKEEREQALIDASVNVDFDNQITSALLPFVCDPKEKLAYNRDTALKVYKQQVMKLSKAPDKREAVLHSERKLQDNGHVDWVSNLSAEQRLLLAEEDGYYLPWRVVENENSVSTPVRLVFDGSSVTSSGYSLNDLLAKGINSMNSMVEIVIRFRSYAVTVHTDIKQMYNVIKLKPEHWKYQRYLMEPQLDPTKPPDEKVIETLIYGVVSSGNQAGCGLRVTALKRKDDIPEASACIIDDSYVDDVATGSDVTTGEKLSSDLVEVLAGGGFVTKGFTISGQPPPPELSKDGVSVKVLGTKWLSEPDQLQLAVGRLNFSKRVRGKKNTGEDAWVVPQKLTKRICMGKVAEIFDIIGFIAPITAGFKLDLRTLVVSSYSWDDTMSDSDRDVWVKNFELMETLSDGVWPRRSIPAEYAAIELIGCGDASEKMACAVCYARVLLKDGTYAVSLLMAKTKIVPEGMSLPRAELMACTLNTHVTEIVKRALKRLNIERCVYVLDSEVSLHWIASDTKRLKPGTRNQVIEILRHTTVDQWDHLESELNPADIGTRKGVVLSDVTADSEWYCGKQWMYKPWGELRGSTLKNVAEVKLKNEQLAELKKEHAKPSSDLCNTGCNLVLPAATTSVASFSSEVTASTRERLLFSRYLVDPNKHKFSHVVRLVAIVMRFCRMLLKSLQRELKRFPMVQPPVGNSNRFVTAAHSTVGLCLTDEEIQHALNYYFRKTTEELKSYVHPKVYERDSFEKDDIVYYTGRVLNSDISYECEMTDTMLDLSADTFIVPIVDRYSPVAYAIVNQFHWEDRTVKHCGIETTIRAIMAVAHILKVRDLVKLTKKNCKRCRYILKKTVDVVMSPASKDQLRVAPPFFITQVDLCGPFKAYSVHNKRTKINVYIATFVCCTTGMTSLKTMQGYDTAQFLDCFTRFACELGFPKKLLTDKGSQLVCGCENVVLNLTTIAGELNRERGIEFSTCPVDGHNFNGKAERKIRTVQDIMIKTMQNDNCKMSPLDWETLCAEIANSVNNMPVAIGNETDELESIDLITPNRLRLGRNNNRSPVGALEVTGKLERMLRLKTDIFESWWNTWLKSAVPKLMPRPKWFVNDRDISVGDVVIFNKGSALVGDYKLGMVKDTTVGSDGRIRAVTIRYRNASEGFDQKTERAVRSLVIIHRVDEIDLMEELGNAAMFADACFHIHMGFPSGSPGV